MRIKSFVEFINESKKDSPSSILKNANAQVDIRIFGAKEVNGKLDWDKGKGDKCVFVHNNCEDEKKRCITVIAEHGVEKFKNGTQEYDKFLKLFDSAVKESEVAEMFNILDEGKVSDFLRKLGKVALISSVLLTSVSSCAIGGRGEDDGTYIFNQSHIEHVSNTSKSDDGYGNCTYDFVESTKTVDLVTGKTDYCFMQESSEKGFIRIGVVYHSDSEDDGVASVLRIDRDGNETEEVVYKKENAEWFKSIEKLAKESHKLEMMKSIN